MGAEGFVYLEQGRYQYTAKIAESARIRTEAHAGPEIRTTAIAALPGAVDSAYIVESASSMNRLC